MQHPTQCIAPAGSSTALLTYLKSFPIRHKIEVEAPCTSLIFYGPVIPALSVFDPNAALLSKVYVLRQTSF